jgi:alkaline phosphatase
MLMILQSVSARVRRICFCLTLLVCIAASAAHAAPPRYVILMIGDGMGWPHVQLAEALLGAQAGVHRVPLHMTTLPVTGLASTHSANNFVTDSAAAATALACGVKTSNGMLGVDSSNTLRFASIATLARQHNRKIGVVTTDTLVGGTPAAFYAHRPDRWSEYAIGADLLASGFDLFVASGGFGDPDGKNVPTNGIATLTNELAAFVAADATGTNASVLWHSLPGLTARYGYAWVDSAQTFRALQPAAHKTIAVVPMPRVLVAASNALTLAEVTRKCLAVLDNPTGFFLMIEGAHIDKLSHQNDGAAVAQEVLAFDRAVIAAYAFYTNHPDETLLVVTADHETGGMTLGNGTRRFKLLARQRMLATEFRGKIDEYRVTHTRRGPLGRWLAAFLRSADAGKKPAQFADVVPLLQQCFGFGGTNADVPLTPAEWQALERAFDDSMRDVQVYLKDAALRAQYGGQDPLTITALRLLNEKAGMRWASLDHSGAMVPVFACGVGRARFAGIQDNTAVAHKIMQVMLPGVAFPVALPRPQ